MEWEIKIDPILGRTILRLYNRLEDWCNALDRSIRRTAYKYSYYVDRPSGSEIYTSIIDYIEKKNIIINFKLTVDRAASRLKPKLFKDYLYLREHERFKIKEVQKEFNCSERTVFRRIDAVCRNLAKRLEECDQYYILRFVNTSKTFVEFYNRYKDGAKGTCI